MVALPWLELDSQTAQLLRVEPPSFAATVHPAGRQDGMVRSWKIGLRLWYSKPSAKNQTCRMLNNQPISGRSLGKVYVFMNVQNPG